MQWIRIIALLLELLSIGLSNEQVVETVSERFGLSKEELEKWLQEEFDYGNEKIYDQRGTGMYPF